MAAALRKAEESHLTWSGDVWRRARHLFGAVCDEKYRVGCAQQILILLGHGKELGEALASRGGGNGDGGAGGTGAGGSGGDGGERGQRSRSRITELESCEQTAGTRQGRGEVLFPTAAVDGVQQELYRCIRLRDADGSLKKEWDLWKLGDHMGEWMTLATAPAGDTATSAVQSVERTPGLYNIFIDMLFIGLSDNTRCAAHMQC